MANPKWFENMKIALFRAYGKNPGKMLIHTGTIGWAMSSIAQIFAILLNDKIPKEQKMFMIPQEFSDAIINILSFYTITNSFTALASKIVKCGKILPKNVKTYIDAIGLAKRVGKWDFDIAKHVKLPKNLKSDYDAFKNGSDVIATLVGSVISCNIVTPILRNIYASRRQKKNIAKLNDSPPSLYKSDNPIKQERPFIRTSLQSFMNSGSLKV